MEDEQPIDPWLLRAVWRLPKRQREVVALRVLLDLSELRTAEALGISQATVGVHLHRALETLRTSLASAGYGSVGPSPEAEAEAEATR